MNALLAIQESVREAVDPKRVMRSLQSKRVWPSNKYFINIIRPREPWEEGEYCPVMVKHDGSCWPSDGMYDLDNDVRNAIHYQEGNPASEEAMEKWMDHYEGAMLREIKAGHTSGTINGIIGPRQWRLVYDEASSIHSLQRVVQVVPGKQYGAALQQEAIDPKRIFKALKMGEFIVIRIYGNDRGQRTWMGSLEVNGRGQTKSVLMASIPEFNQSWVERIVRDLHRGQLGGNFGRTVNYWWSTDDHEGVHKVADTTEPILTVTTPDWTIQMPVIYDTRNDMLGWLARDLTPAQKEFMEEHGEPIWYAMNEGNDYEDDIRHYPGQGDEIVVGRWSVTGNPEIAPKHGEDWGYG